MGYDKISEVNLIDELDNTFEDVKNQLIEDNKRWGDTWKKRGLVFDGKTQEERFFNKIKEYWSDFSDNDKEFPWDKVIGECHIAKVREKISK